MQKGSLTIATLNLWRFDEWEKRESRLVEAIRAADPDIIFFQEVERDPTYWALTQMEMLNEKLSYGYSAFTRACVKTMRKGAPLPAPIDHGIGTLSKLPLTVREIMLSKAPDEKEQQALMKIDLTLDGKPLTFVNVHFSNTDVHALQNFKETLNLIRDTAALPILIGDFNIKDMQTLKPLYGDAYTASSELYQYVSYPKDGLAYDQILLPKGISFKSFKCVDSDISDHRMLVAEIAF